jgi:hypothetical protein
MHERLTDLEGRRDRIEEQARLEKAALVELDRAATRLETATERHSNLVAQAAAAITEARRAHEHALASYARCAGLERAARFLELDERELRRLVREVAP